MKYSIGIDLGTTFSAAASVDETGRPRILPNSEGKLITPSIIFFGNGEPIGGDEAKEMQALGESNIASFFKRNMGNPGFILELNNRKYTPTDLSAILLKKLKADAEAALKETVTHAVITVPAYFNNFQRETTIKAGEMAGLNVMRIINEPTAAALAYGVNWVSNDQTFLVYDLGGGTFDVSIVRITQNLIKVIATDGDHELGGKDWDDRIAVYLDQQFYQEYSLGLTFQDYQNPKNLKSCDILFLNCGTSNCPDTKSLKNFVDKGGCLYASDLTYSMIESAFSGFIAFEGSIGEAGHQTAKIVDPELQAAIGKTIKITFDMSSWAVIDSVESSVTVIMRSKDTDKPLMVVFKYGEGTVFYTSFHNHTQASKTEQFLLQILVLKQISAVSGVSISKIAQVITDNQIKTQREKGLNKNLLKLYPSKKEE